MEAIVYNHHSEFPQFSKWVSQKRQFIDKCELALLVDSNDTGTSIDLASKGYLV